MEKTPTNANDFVTKKELETLLSEQTEVILQALDERITVRDQRFDVADKRFAAIDQRFDAIDRRFDMTDDRFVAQDLRMDKLEQKLDDRFDTVITKLDGVMKELQAHREEDVCGAAQLRRHDDQLGDHEHRIKTLELQPHRLP